MNIIEKYLVENGTTNQAIINKYIDKISKYDDIYTEAIHAIETGSFPEKEIEIEGYTASEIYEIAPFMNFVGVYNFLVDLKDTPEKAKNLIASGFQVK